MFLFKCNALIGRLFKNANRSGVHMPQCYGCIMEHFATRSVSYDAVHVTKMSELLERCIAARFSTKKLFVDGVICSDVCLWGKRASATVARRHIKVGLHVQVPTFTNDFSQRPSHALKSSDTVGGTELFIKTASVWIMMFWEVELQLSWVHNFSELMNKISIWQPQVMKENRKYNCDLVFCPVLLLWVIS